MALRAVGYFATAPGDRRPDVRTQIDSFWEQARRSRIVIYLRAGAVFEPSTLMGRCLLCSEPVGSRDLTDGMWLWPESLAHYVEKHSVRVPDEMVAQMASHQFRAPKVDVKMLKIAATGLLDRPRELVAPPGTNPTVAETPSTRAPGQSKKIARSPAPPKKASRAPATDPLPGRAIDLDDATAAVPLGDLWMASIAGVPGQKNVVPFEGPVVVGRDAKFAQIVVNHGSISRKHCRLIPSTRSVIVQDLDSQNGVLVRGKKVAQAELSDGETFQIGPAIFTLKRSKP